MDPCYFIQQKLCVCMSAFLDYIERIFSGIPESAKEAMESFDDWEEEFNSHVRGYDVETEEGLEFANRWIRYTQEELSKIVDGLKGKAKPIVERTISQLVENGWKYFIIEGEVSTSHSKGAGGVRFNSISYKSTNQDFAQIEAGENTTLTWPLSKIQLSERSPLFVTSVPAWELDLVSSVPALESKLSHMETYRRIKDAEVEGGKWQRAINVDNRQAIAEFFDRSTSFFTNPVILHCKNSDSLRFNGERTMLNISLDFFNEHKTSMNDNGLDTRPFVIIDGQHRVRGASNSLANSQNLVPVIILSDEFSGNVTGRIFSEINTLSQPLKDKHRMFLSHRFKVKSPQLKFTFGVPGPDDDEANFQRDRGNRLAYELASRMSVFSEFWEHRIKILDQNLYNGQVIEIEKWVEYSHVWFTDYPYTTHNPLDTSQKFKEIESYFDAWGDVIGWETWHQSGLNQCLFKSKTQARVMLMRFPQVYQIAKTLYPGEGVLSKTHFREVLKPLENIPFTNETILDVYNNSFTPEVSWQLLDTWVSDAISGQISHNEADILGEIHRGIPGMGIISMPVASDELEYTLPDNGLNPSDGTTRYLEVKRPINASAKCKIEFWSGAEQLETRGASWKSRVISGNETIPIRCKGAVADTESDLDIVIKWQTIRGWTELRLQIK